MKRRLILHNTVLKVLALAVIETLAVVAGTQSQAQAPSVTYFPYLGAQIIGVDAQTNVYANSGGKVYTFSGSGVPLQTNQICPASVSAATRDGAGNFYFAGNYSPPQSFGSVTLTNNLIYYVAKYNAAGTLVWVMPFGPAPTLLHGNALTDLKVDSAGNVYAGYYYFYGSLNPIPEAVKFSAGGSKLWTAGVPATWVAYSSAGSTVRFGPLSPTNGYVVEFDALLGSPPNYVPNNYAQLSSFDAAGVMTGITNWGQSGAVRLYDRPSGDPAGEWFSAEAPAGGGVPLLVKRGPAGIQLGVTAVSVPQWILAGDVYGGTHAGDDGGHITRYDYDRALVWTLNMPALVSSMIVDEQGNRFFSLSTGAIGRLGAEPVTGPSITIAPQGLTVLAGSNAVFSAGVTGSGPLRFNWQFNGAPIAGATNTTLNMANVGTLQGGLYALVASNFVGSVTSAPALLRVRSVAIFSGNQILTNGNYVFGNPPTLTVGSAFTNGTVFYTLDGSPPTFASPFYSGPFVLSNSATVRALGYSSDFSQSQEADIVTATVYGTHTLVASTAGGGSVSLNPPGGTYSGTNIVTASATPAPGYSFLYWQGDASGYSANLPVATDRDKSIVAVFGTTISTVPGSGGQIQATPPGGPYPYGSVVRLTAVPQAGNYFAVWGSAGSGTGNPLYFTVTNPTPTVSALFQPTTSSQAALIVLLQGPGLVNVSPNANVYSTNATVTLTATAASGKGFVGWAGDATGSQNPLSVALTQNKIITAVFTNWPGLWVNGAAGDGLKPEGYRFTIISGTQMVYQVFASTNLAAWESVGVVTNVSGQVQFTDPGALTRPRNFYKAVGQ